MRQILTVLRLKHTTDLSQRQIAKQCNIARSTVREYLYRADKAGLSTWPLPEQLDETQVEHLLFADAKRKDANRPLPNWPKVHKELKRKHVTLFLLWEEYKAQHPTGYGYSRFCHYYRNWLKCCDVTMRQEHRAGEKLFVDYCGHTINVICSVTGELKPMQIFVAVLGASNYTYAEATESQSLKDWIGSHVRAFQYFGGVSEIIVPDNLRSAVNQAHRYEPLLNDTYQELAEHYDTCIIPARVRRPKDKAKAEGGVLLVSRWILARLRNQQYFSLHDLNADILRLLDLLNQRPFKKLIGSRLSLFQSVDKPALKPLPNQAYQYAEWLKGRVHPNAHVQVKAHYYSVPHALIKRELDVRLTERTVELFHKGKRVASHTRSQKAHHYTTVRTHLPQSHQSYGEWSPTRFLQCASQIGIHTYELIQAVLGSRKHPQQAYRSCFGILKELRKQYGDERLESACQRALALGGHSYRSIESILRHGLDQQPLPTIIPMPTPVVEHENVRGADYYTLQ